MRSMRMLDLWLAIQGLMALLLIKQRVTSHRFDNSSSTCKNQECYYSRTSLAQTLMACLPRLFRAPSWVPWNKSHRCRFGIIKDDFLFLYWGMVYCVYSLESPRWGNFNENTQYTFMLKKIEKISLLCNLTWLCNKPSMARTTPVLNKF